tara:strand:+ start:10482 stop:11069 length:588 start_codon:yes stop_codon:yes gene_type:complete
MLTAAFVALAGSACASGATYSDTLESSSVLEIDGRTLTFQPTREDFSIESAVFTVHCSQEHEVKLNGAKPGSAWNYIKLERVADNRFALAPTKIALAGDARGIVCLSIKVWFREVGNQYDSLFYRNPDDRYGLVSWCNNPQAADWQQAKHRFAQNRVETLAEFQDALNRPFVIELNERPLSDVAAFQAENSKAPR